MSSEPSPYRELGLNARLTGREKRKDSVFVPMLNEKSQSWGHIWQLGEDRKFDRAGLLIPTLLNRNETCQRCGGPRFAVETKDCLTIRNYVRSGNKKVVLHHRWSKKISPMT